MYFLKQSKSLITTHGFSALPQYRGKIKIWNPENLSQGPKGIFEGHQKRVIYGGLGSD
jgi:WD40 repeat protein